MSTAFLAILESSQEVPPNNSTASGIGTVIFDSEAVAASYSFNIVGVDYGPITGRPAQTPTVNDDDVTSTHFHNQVRGENGPVVFGQINPAQDTDDLAIVLNANGSWTVSGIWETTDPANVSVSNFAADERSDGGQIPILFDVLSGAAGNIKGGSVRALAVTTKERSPSFPDVPTVSESGLPGYETYTWNAVFGPRGMAPDLVGLLSKEFQQIVADDQIKARFAELSAIPVGSTPQELAKQVDVENEKWAPVVLSAGLKN